MNPQGSRFNVLGQLAALRRYARALTRDDSDAEDLVHDALVRAYERRDSFRPGGDLRAWLLSILHNGFVDRMRSRRAEARRIERSAEIAPVMLDAPQEHAARLSQVKQSFLSLPDEQRAALHLVAIEGLSYQEAAEALDVPVGTLMSRIGRARAALRLMEDGGRDRPALRIVGGRDE